jgi:hypothetical protein
MPDPLVWLCHEIANRREDPIRRKTPHAPMVERALTQHTWTAPDVVDHHLDATAGARQRCGLPL